MKLNNSKIISALYLHYFMASSFNSLLFSICTKQTEKKNTANNTTSKGVIKNHMM